MRLDKDDIDKVWMDGTITTTDVYKVEVLVYDDDKWTEEEVKNIIDVFKDMNPHIVVETYTVHYEEECDGVKSNWIDIYYSFIDWYKNINQNVKLEFVNERGIFYPSFPFSNNVIEIFKNKRVLVVNSGTREGVWKDVKDIVKINWE